MVGDPIPRGEVSRAGTTGAGPLAFGTKVRASRPLGEIICDMPVTSGRSRPAMTD
jgi:hypothetical protein